MKCEETRGLGCKIPAKGSAVWRMMEKAEKKSRMDSAALRKFPPLKKVRIPPRMLIRPGKSHTMVIKSSIELRKRGLLADLAIMKAPVKKEAPMPSSRLAPRAVVKGVIPR